MSSSFQDKKAELKSYGTQYEIQEQIVTQTYEWMIKNFFMRNMFRITDIKTGMGDRISPAFIKYVNPKKELKILDIGCGTGWFLIKLALNGFKDVHGIDLSPTNVALAKRVAAKFGLNLDIKQMDLSKIPYRNEFDIITSCGVLHHFPWLPEPLYYINKALKTDGVLFAYEPNKIFPMTLLTFYLIHSSKHRTTNEHFFSPLTLTRCCQSSGFKNVEVFTNYLFPSITNCIKKIPLCNYFGHSIIAVAKKA